jgi:hypothetical protein
LKGNIAGNQGLFGARMRQFDAIFPVANAKKPTKKPSNGLIARLFTRIFRFLADLPYFLPDVAFLGSVSGISVG